MRILHLDANVNQGGAGKIACALASLQKKAGNDVIAVTGHASKTGAVRQELLLSGGEVPVWSNFFYGLERLAEKNGEALKGLSKYRTLMHRLACPTRLRDWWLGKEDFNLKNCFEFIARLNPDIVHCHNLHGFDLTSHFNIAALRQIESIAPILFTLHDAWLLSGHCAHSFDCDKWRRGCGECPNLKTYPAIRRDATRSNFEFKKKQLGELSATVVTPSKWLSEKVGASHLSHMHRHVIRNGIDLNAFRPGNRTEARSILKLSADRFILLAVGDFRPGNPFKDVKTLLETLKILSTPSPVQVIALGGSDLPAKVNGHTLTCVPYTQSTSTIVHYYRAADLLIHPAKAETAPNAIAEAMACALPVVATDVGGIPEFLRPTPESPSAGLLVAPYDPVDMMKAVVTLKNDDNLRAKIGRAGAERARQSLSQDMMHQHYLSLYKSVIFPSPNTSDDASIMKSPGIKI